MILNKWEVWHTFSTFLDAGSLDLWSCGRSLVESRLGLLAYMHDGRVLWRSDAGLHHGTTLLAPEPSRRHGTMQIQPGGTLDEYSQACWLAAGTMRFHENELLDPDRGSPEPYVRVFLGPILFRSTNDEEELVATAIAKLYASGILLVELRLASDDAIPLDAFINRCVNLAFHDVTAFVPPAVAELAPTVYRETQRAPRSALGRMVLVRENLLHRRGIEELTYLYRIGDIGFELAPLPRSEDYHETSSSVLTLIAASIGYVVSTPRSGLGLVLFGQRPLVGVGNYWMSRPHIYILDFEGCKQTASLNEAAHGNDFGLILARLPPNGSNFGRSFLPRNSREHIDDVGVYFALSGSLWVSSRTDPDSSIDSEKRILQHQVVLEEGEYCNAVRRRALETSLTHNSFDSVAQARVELFKVDRRREEASHFGEMYQIFATFDAATNSDNTASAARQALVLAETRTSVMERRRTERGARSLEVVLGFLAVPLFATEVLDPLWRVLDFARPSEEEAFQLLLIGVASLIYVILLFGLSRFVQSE